MSALYRDMGLGPDSLVSVEIGGVLYTDYFKNLTPSPVQRLSCWQRLVRRFTPKRFRKPLTPATPVQRALAQLAQAQRVIDGLMK